MEEPKAYMTANLSEVLDTNEVAWLVREVVRSLNATRSEDYIFIGHHWLTDGHRCELGMRSQHDRAWNIRVVPDLHNSPLFTDIGGYTQLVVTSHYWEDYSSTTSPEASPRRINDAVYAFYEKLHALMIKHIPRGDASDLDKQISWRELINDGEASELTPTYPRLFLPDPD